MIRSPRLYRTLTGSALLAGMVLLWTGGVIHYGQGDLNDPATLLADVRAYPGATLAKAATDIASMACFLLAAIGLAATVRGRGRTFTVAVALLLGLAVPSHVLGASYLLTLTKVTNANLAAADETRLVSELATLQNVYFLSLVPFLLGMLLLPAAL